MRNRDVPAMHNTSFSLRSAVETTLTGSASVQ